MDDEAEPPQILSDAIGVYEVQGPYHIKPQRQSSLGLSLLRPCTQEQLEALSSRLKANLAGIDELPYGAQVTGVRAVLRSELEARFQWSHEGSEGVNFILRDDLEAVDLEQKLDKALIGVKCPSVRPPRESFRDALTPVSYFGATVAAATKALRCHGHEIDMNAINRLMDRLSREDPCFKKYVTNKLQVSLEDDSITELPPKEHKAAVYVEARVYAFFAIVEQRLGRPVHEVAYDWLNVDHEPEEIHGNVIPGIPNEFLLELAMESKLGQESFSKVEALFRHVAPAALNSEAFLNLMSWIIDIQWKKFGEHCTPDDIKMMLRESFADDLAERCGPLLERAFGQSLELNQRHLIRLKGAKLKDSPTSKAGTLIELYLESLPDV